MIVAVGCVHGALMVCAVHMYALVTIAAFAPFGKVSALVARAMRLACGSLDGASCLFVVDGEGIR